MPNVSPFLWYDHQAEDAAKLYCSIFPNSRITDVTRYGEAGNGAAGKVMTVSFELDGARFTAINGGPHFRFTEAVSFVIDCETQEEIDHYWEKLLAGGGSPSQCGWLKDRFGLSWQVVPKEMADLVGGPDPEKARRATEAMLKMVKLDIAELRRAHAG